MKKNNLGALFATSLLGFFLITVSSNASSTTIFSDNFEDGDHTGWQVSSTGGSGSTGVSLNNGSQRAFVQHTGSRLHSLSSDFIYTPDQTLSFDMQAIDVSTLFRTQVYTALC